MSSAAVVIGALRVKLTDARQSVPKDKNLLLKQQSLSLVSESLLETFVIKEILVKKVYLCKTGCWISNYPICGLHTAL